MLASPPSEGPASSRRVLPAPTRREELPGPTGRRPSLCIRITRLLQPPHAVNPARRHPSASVPSHPKGPRATPGARAEKVRAIALRLQVAPPLHVPSSRIVSRRTGRGRESLELTCAEQASGPVLVPREDPSYTASWFWAARGSCLLPPLRLAPLPPLLLSPLLLRSQLRGEASSSPALPSCWAPRTDKRKGRPVGGQL